MWAPTVRIDLNNPKVKHLRNYKDIDIKTIIHDAIVTVFNDLTYTGEDVEVSMRAAE